MTARQDLGEHLDEAVYPALFKNMDSAFPEFGWKWTEGPSGGSWTAFQWPIGFPLKVENEHPDRLRVYPDRPYWVKVHGHEGVRLLDYVNGGRRPTGLEFVAAVRKLCELAGVPFPELEMTEEEQERYRAKEARRAVLLSFSSWAKTVLWSQAGEDALAYLKDRGLSEEAIRDLDLGFYSSVTEARAVLEAAGHDQEDIKASGVLWSKLESYILFPWADALGQPLTIYTRWPAKVPPKGKKKTLALPGAGTKASPLYFDRARRAGHQDLVAVEGVIDAAVLQSLGDTRVVAYVAAQFSGLQVKTMERYKVRSVVIVPDPDGGGAKGAVSSVKSLTQHGIEPYVAPELPDGLDPDEFAQREGIEGWQQHVSKAISGAMHLALRDLGDVAPDSPAQERRAAVDRVSDQVRKLSGPQAALDRDDILKLTAERTGYSRAVLEELLGSTTSEQAEERDDVPPDDDDPLEDVDGDSEGPDKPRGGQDAGHAPVETRWAGKRRPPGRGAKDDGRPEIYAGDRDLGEVIDEAWSAVEQFNMPPSLFRFGSKVSIVADDDGRPIIRQMTPDSWREILARSGRWFRVTQKETIDENGEIAIKHIRKDTKAPGDVARCMLAGEGGSLPVLIRIVGTPIMAPSGRIVQKAGYNKETRCWYAPGPLSIRPVPSQPTAPEIEAAREMIVTELLGDFPFVEEADRANTLALFLLHFVREVIDGPTPLHLIEKPSPGSGASLMLDAMGTVICGSPPGVITEAREEEEWRKRITSTLLNSPELFIIDNLSRMLDSASLSAALTTRVWGDRRLGVSENVSIPIRCCWAATGNNPSVSNEIARRCISIRIDPKVARPWERKGFRHPNLLEWADKNRAQLVHAALTLLRAWVAAGRPEGSESLGSYERWSAIMGGVLSVAGVEGFMLNRARFYSRADRESATWLGFIEAWWERFRDEPVGVRELWAVVDAIEVPFDLGRGSERAQKTRLGTSLARTVDRRFVIGQRSLKVEAVAGKKNGARYSLMECSSAASSDSGNLGNVGNLFPITPRKGGLLAESEQGETGSPGSPGSPNAVKEVEA